MSDTAWQAAGPATNTALPAITVGANPAAIAFTPDSKTAYVLNSGTDSVTPIRTATNTALPAITVGRNRSASRSPRTARPPTSLARARAR